MSRIYHYSQLLKTVKGTKAKSRILKIIEELGIAHVRKICYKKKLSLPLKLMKQRKSKINCPLTHVPDVESYTGTKIVLSDTFDIPTPLAGPKMYSSNRKRKATDLIVVNPKYIRYWDKKQTFSSDSCGVKT